MPDIFDAASATPAAAIIADADSYAAIQRFYCHTTLMPLRH
jgi:hypothetical protein